MQVKFQILFDYSFDQLQSHAVVDFEAKRYRELKKYAVKLFSFFLLLLFSSENVQRFVSFAVMAEKKTLQTMRNTYPFLCSMTQGLCYPSEFCFVYLFYFSLPVIIV